MNQIVQRDTSTDQKQTKLKYVICFRSKQKEIIKHMGIIVADMGYLTWILIRSLAHAWRQGFWMGR
jgi:hypothetical protein